MRSRRYLSIDILRTFAIVMMVQTHFMEFLTPEKNDYETMYLISVWDLPGIVSAPLFSFLLGLSYWLWYKKSEFKGVSEKMILKTSLFRGVFIFIFGLFFSVSIFLPDQIFSWDILTFLGSSLIILSLLRRAPVSVFLILIALVLISAPIFRDATNYASHWVDHEYIYNFTPYDFITGYLSHGYFGILPWIISPLLGYSFGKFYFSEESMRIENKSAGIIGAILIISGYTLSYTGILSEITFYPANTSFLMTYMGICIFSCWFFYNLIDKKGVSNPKNYHFFSLYGKYSLSAYYIHHAFHLWPIYLLACFEGKEIDYYYNNLVTPPIALSLAIFFVITFYFVLKLWDKRGGKYTLEWIMHKQVQKIQ